MNSQTVASFWELYRKLPKEIRARAREAYRRFLANPVHPSLRFHRLAVDEDLWSVRISRDYRAVGLVEGNTITWFWIGHHQAFDRTFPV
jgi:mRNA-degrading endonuclease RelE of RelBE toxin-antitoxin system